MSLEDSPFTPHVISGPQTDRDRLCVRLAQTPGTLAEATYIVKELLSNGYARWRPMAGPPSNIGMVQAAQRAHVIIKEVPKNGQEGLLEAAVARRQEKDPDTPEEAARLLGITPEKMASSSSRRLLRKIAEQVSVTYEDGVNYPNITIVDRGIGVLASDVFDTIAAVGSASKANKPHLLGEYGWGASTANGFSPNGTLKLSRKQPSFLSSRTPDQVVIVWIQRIESKALGGALRYEVIVNPDGTPLTVPAHWVQEKVPGSFLKDGYNWETQPFQPGTRIVHYEYEMRRQDARLMYEVRNVVSKVWATLFPRCVLPFIIYDCREVEHLRNSLRKGKDTTTRTRVIRGCMYMLAMNTKKNVIYGLGSEGAFQITYKSPSAAKTKPFR